MTGAFNPSRICGFKTIPVYCRARGLGNPRPARARRHWTGVHGRLSRDPSGHDRTSGPARPPDPTGVGWGGTQSRGPWAARSAPGLKGRGQGEGRWAVPAGGRARSALVGGAEACRGSDQLFREGLSVAPARESRRKEAACDFRALLQKRREGEGREVAASQVTVGEGQPRVGRGSGVALRG